MSPAVVQVFARICDPTGISFLQISRSLSRLARIALTCSWLLNIAVFSASVIWATSPLFWNICLISSSAALPLMRSVAVTYE